MENSSLLTVTDFNGKVLGEVVTPEGLAVSGLYYHKEKKELTFRLSSYSVPAVTCQLDLSTYKFIYLGKKQLLLIPLSINLHEQNSLHMTV